MLAAAGVVAAHDGAPLDEPMVAGLAGGIGFMYFSFSYAGHVPTMTIVPRIHPRPFLAGALERAGIAHRVSETTSAAKAARELDAALDAGRTPICTVDRAGLAPPGLGRRFAGAEPYDVAVAGRRGRRLLLDDERLEPIEVRAEAFAAARAAHRKSRHRMLVVDPAPGRSTSPRRSGRRARGHRARPHRGRHAGQLRRQLRPARAGEVGDAGRPTGAAAKGWTRLFDSGPAFGARDAAAARLPHLDYSSPGAMRPLYADFLTSAADV